MPRNRRQIQRGVQWRRNLRNLPVRQAAAQAALGKQPAAIAAPPQPPPPPPPPQPPQPVVKARGRARGRARRRARGRAAAAAAGGPPPGRRPIAAAGHGEKILIMHLLEIEVDIKLRGCYQLLKTLTLRDEASLLGE